MHVFFLYFVKKLHVLKLMKMLIFAWQILRVLGENAIAVRTKAMKCLSEVVAVDPSILARVRRNINYSYYVPFIFKLKY